MQDRPNGEPRGEELQRKRRKQLDVDRFDICLEYFNSDPTYDLLLEAVNALLQDNPHILPDLELEHEDHPNELSMAIFPKYELIIARINDQTLAVVPELTCTSGAIGMLFEIPCNGYQIFHYPGEYSSEYGMWIPSRFIDFTLRGNPDMNPFNFDYIKEHALGYIAGDVLGYIASNDEDNTDFGELSPRVTLPWPVKEN